MSSGARNTAYASITPFLRPFVLASVLQDASFVAPLMPPWLFMRYRGVDVVVVPSSAAQEHNLSAAAFVRELRPHASSNCTLRTECMVAAVISNCARHASDGFT